MQECKALNARLVDFLERPESVAKLLQYLVQPAPRNADDKRQSKYPFASCEVSSVPLFCTSPYQYNEHEQTPTLSWVQQYPFVACEVSLVLSVLLLTVSILRNEHYLKPQLGSAETFVDLLEGTWESRMLCSIFHHFIRMPNFTKTLNVTAMLTISMIQRREHYEYREHECWAAHQLKPLT